MCDARILCLGNDLLADDSFGYAVADRLRPYADAGTEVVSTSETGFYLMDYLLNARVVVVVDSVLTGKAPVGTIYVLGEGELKVVNGGSPHYVGLSESVALARELRMPVAEAVIIVAVEIADCLTMGGRMNPALTAVIPEVLGIVRSIVTSKRRCKTRPHHTASAA